MQEDLLTGPAAFPVLQMAGWSGGAAGRRFALWVRAEGLRKGKSRLMWWLGLGPVGRNVKAYPGVCVYPWDGETVKGWEWLQNWYSNRPEGTGSGSGGRWAGWKDREGLEIMGRGVHVDARGKGKEAKMINYWQLEHTDLSLHGSAFSEYRYCF